MPQIANYTGSVSVRIERGGKSLSIDIELPDYSSSVEGTMKELDNAIGEIRSELEAEEKRANPHKQP